MVKKEAENVLPKWLRFVKGNIRQLYIDYYILGILLLKCSFLFFDTTILKYNKVKLLILIFIGVIDSEDIPLNLSREMLQNSSLLRYKLHIFNKV